MQLKINPINFRQSQAKKQKNERFKSTTERKETKNVSFFNSGILSAIYSIKKSQEINSLKTKLIKAYDLIYEDLAIDAKKIGINFIKPDLIFKKLNRGLQACYLSGINAIEINDKTLYGDLYARYNCGTYAIDTLDDGTEIPCPNFAYGARAKHDKNEIYIEADEKIFYLAGTLKHELTHALQEQIMLSGENNLEKLYLILKEKHPQRYKK